MKIYIWNEVDGASGAYHSTSGVVVVAPTETRARELVEIERKRIREATSPKYREDDIREIPAVDACYPLAGEYGEYTESVFVFPGCCE